MIYSVLCLLDNFFSNLLHNLTQSNWNENCTFLQNRTTNFLSRLSPGDKLKKTWDKSILKWHHKKVVKMNQFRKNKKICCYYLHKYYNFLVLFMDSGLKWRLYFFKKERLLEMKLKKHKIKVAFAFRDEMKKLLKASCQKTKKNVDHILFNNFLILSFFFSVIIITGAF